jgi:hypothetical protein
MLSSLCSVSVFFLLFYKYGLLTILVLNLSIKDAYFMHHWDDSYFKDGMTCLHMVVCVSYQSLHRLTYMAQYNKYKALFPTLQAPATDTASNTTPTSMFMLSSAVGISYQATDNSDAHGAFYSASWRHNMLKSCQIADANAGTLCDELGDYLSSPIESTSPNKVIQWWRVHFSNH